MKSRTRPHLRCHVVVVLAILVEHPILRAVFEASKILGPFVCVLVQLAAVVVSRFAVAVSADPLEDVDAVPPTARHPFVARALGVALVGSPVRVRDILSAEAFYGSDAEQKKRQARACLARG